MDMRNSTTFIAGLVVGCFLPPPYMAPSGFEITFNTTWLSWVHKRRPRALLHSHFSVSSCFLLSNLSESTSARFSSMFSTCTCCVHRDELIEVSSVLTYVSFFVTICYHTIYARPWIYPALAFYALDLLLRLFRYRIKDATLTSVGNMTIVRSCPSFTLRSLFNDAFAD